MREQVRSTEAQKAPGADPAAVVRRAPLRAAPAPTTRGALRPGGVVAGTGDVLAVARAARLPASAADPSVGRARRSDVIRRELDPALRDGLIHQRGAARGIDARSATRDVDRSAGARPAAPQADPGAEEAERIEAERKAAEKQQLRARFDEPENVATRQRRAEEERLRQAAAEASAQAQAAGRAEWEATVAEQRAGLARVTERRETLILEGLDDALLLNHPELHRAVADVKRASASFDVAGAERAVATAERCFAEVSALVEQFDDLQTRFVRLETLGIGAKKRKAADSVRTALSERTTKPWKEFGAGLTDVAATVTSLEGTRQRREEHEGAAAERKLVEQAEHEFARNPKKETLQAQLDKQLIGRGEVTRTYRSSDDTGPGEFSVEVTIKRLSSIVIHAHCHADGTPKPGGATHWKYFTERKIRGRSHPLTTKLIGELVDKNAAKRHRDKNPALKGT